MSARSLSSMIGRVAEGAFANVSGSQRTRFQQSDRIQEAAPLTRRCGFGVTTIAPALTR